MASLLLAAPSKLQHDTVFRLLCALFFAMLLSSDVTLAQDPSTLDANNAPGNSSVSDNQGEQFPFPAYLLAGQPVDNLVVDWNRVSFPEDIMYIISLRAAALTLITFQLSLLSPHMGVVVIACNK